MSSALDVPQQITIPGAIRWDAWYAPSPINSNAAAALAPQQWHFRAPWFAQVPSTDMISIDGGQQAVVDKEIEYAASAGLKYWAYVWYGRDHPMQAAWRLHQSSPIKGDMKWCHILQLSNQGGRAGFRTLTPLYVEHFGQSNYQKVLGGKPVVYLFLNKASTMQNWGGASLLGEALREFRVAVTKVHENEPYLVILAASESLVSFLVDRGGCDAISTYVPVVQSGNPVDWPEQEASVERRWELEAASGHPMVVNCFTGWDPRPRIEHERPNSSAPNYTTKPTPVQLTAHLQSAVDFTRRHPDICASRLILIYSWDECDEGGNVIVPSFTPDGPDTAVLAEVRQVRW